MTICIKIVRNVSTVITGGLSSWIRSWKELWVELESGNILNSDSALDIKSYIGVLVILNIRLSRLKIHVVVMKCLMIPFTILVGLPLLIHIELLGRSHSGSYCVRTPQPCIHICVVLCLRIQQPSGIFVLCSLVAVFFNLEVVTLYIPSSVL
jgi:hypothetical protein